MDEPIAYLDGRFIPFASLAISPLDNGFLLGATVAEQMRTFAGRIFRLHDHLSRLAGSLKIIGISIAESMDRLAEIAEELAAHNHGLLQEGDDLGIGIFVTPGPSTSYGPADREGPTVCLHTYPLPFHLWRDKYVTGQKLAVPSTRQVPGQCWPSALKCRSRMHYYLADREAAEAVPGARALLLDVDGYVTEASTANLLLFHDGQGLVSPPHCKVLPGISLAHAAELAGGMGTGLTERDLTVDDVCSADEVFLTSTPLCLLPVTELNGHPIASGAPGAFFRRLIDAWNESVGIDIIAQARRFACRI